MADGRFSGSGALSNAKAGRSWQELAVAGEDPNSLEERTKTFVYIYTYI